MQNHRLDEPLDMSLKSRKRSSPNEYLPKKKRAASAMAREPEVPLQLLKTEPVCSSRVSDEPNSNIIVIELSNNDVEEHFRRSLCRDMYNDVEISSQGVDDHFRRSLGTAKWEEIQRKSLPVKSIQSPTPSRTVKK